MKAHIITAKQMNELSLVNKRARLRERRKANNVEVVEAEKTLAEHSPKAATTPEKVEEYHTVQYTLLSSITQCN